MGGVAADPFVAVALGSNLGDREHHLQVACAHLARLLSELRVSSFHETTPAGVTTPQSDYLNAAAVGRTTLTPGALLEALLDLERRQGRERPYPNAPRTLDLDLILYGATIVNEPGLQIPHPRFRERRFVLEPLAEVAPDLRDPVTGRSIAALLDALPLRR